jgi:hypothetical protein
MSTITRALHASFLAPLQEALLGHGDVSQKPLEVDLRLPAPPRLRLYMYSLVDGSGSQRPTEYKAVLRVPGQRVGEYGSFDHSGGRFVLVVGYWGELDVFVLWDTSMHARFKNGGNIQVKHDTVHNAAGYGFSRQVRTLANGCSEAVLACQSAYLLDAINRRIVLTGGVD